MLGAAQSKGRFQILLAVTVLPLPFSCDLCSQFVYTHTGDERELQDLPCEAPEDPTWILVRVLLGFVLSSHVFIPASTSVWIDVVRDVPGVFP